MVFGQPPRSLLVPDATFKGKINEEELAEPSQEEESDNMVKEPDDHNTIEQGDRDTAEQSDQHKAEQSDHDRDTAEQSDQRKAEQSDHDTAKQSDQRKALQSDRDTAEQSDHDTAKQSDCDRDTAEQSDQRKAEHSDRDTAEQSDHDTAEQSDCDTTEQSNQDKAEQSDRDTAKLGDTIAGEPDNHGTLEHDDNVSQAPKKHLKKPLATLSKHRNVREKADFLYRRNAERMKQKHSLVHKVKKFSVGESVGLRIPRIDRTATDVHRLPCVIVKVVGKAQDMYRLRCSSGVLHKCYRADELEPFAGSYNIPVNGWEGDVRVSLREAARDHAPWNTFTGNRCSCSGSCDTRKCHCKKTGISCSSHCHKGTHCKNKQYDEENKLRLSTVKEGNLSFYYYVPYFFTIAMYCIYCYYLHFRVQLPWKR